MLARTDSRARAFVLLLLLSLIATVIGGRLAFWHVLQHDRLSAMAADQLAQNQEIPAERLKFRPEATRCVPCQARWDREHRRTA